MTNEEITKKLAEPFKACEIEWRLQGIDQTSMRDSVIPYVDSRAIQQRLECKIFYKIYSYCKMKNNFHSTLGLTFSSPEIM